MTGNITNYYSAAIYKSQLPPDCRHIDVVLAIIEQYNEDVVDCVQPLNGLYKIDLTYKNAHLDILTKGLNIFGRTIPVIQWLDGMDCPQVRLVIRGLDKDHPTEPIIQALSKLGLQPTSGMYDEKWKNPKTGKDLGVRSGNKVVFVKKSDIPIPSNLKVDDKEATIWYWGQRNAPKSGSIFGNNGQTKKNPTTESGNVVNNQNPELTQSLFSQDKDKEDDDFIEPTPSDVVPKKSDKANQQNRRGRSRSTSRADRNKRDLSQSRMDSPSKFSKSARSTPSSSLEIYLVENPKPVKAAGKKPGST